MAITVSELTYYPIKSLKGHRVTQREIVDTGFADDRQFMLVDQKNNLVTQAECHRLALAQPQLIAEQITVTAPGVDPEPISVSYTGQRLEVDIWGETCGAIDMGDHAADWFSAYTQMDVRLLRKDPAYFRQCDQTHATDATDQTGFADAFPFLLISEASLEELNNRLTDDLLMDRFRPNIVVKGTESFAEDTWQRIRISEIEFHIVMPCVRCVVTTIDQATGIGGKEPLKTLATFRKFEGEVWFGQYAVHKGTGSIAVGDPVEVLA